MKVLSLFNGISGLHCAFDRAGIKVDTCYYSEIDKYANMVTEKHYPNDIALGDVTKWKEWNIDWSSIDFVSAGFPCQAWSVAGNQLGDKDERGALFWTTLDVIANVLKHNPNAKFLMENVKMKKDFEQYITHHTEQALGYVEKTLINSALVSAQNRNRYYWTNFKVTQPDDKGILLRDVIETIVDRKFNLSDEAIDYMGRLRNGKPRWEYHKNPINAKSACLTANMYKGVPYGVVVLGGAIRGRYIVDGKRQDHKMKTAGLTEQRLEVRNDEKTNTLTTVQKDNVVVFKDKSQTLLATIYKENAKSMVKRNKFGLLVGNIQNESATKENKAYSLTASYGGAVAWNSCQKKQRTMIPVAESSEEHPNIYNGVLYRKLTPLECERLQTLPDNWTDCISNTQRYKSIGNGWTIDVIAHILKCMVNK